MQVGVVMGGVSGEREISFLTGKEIIDNLDKSKYEVIPVPINSEYELIDRVKCLEFAFIALHGNFGEDGKIQAILKSLNVPFSGSNVLASAACMNKDISKKIFAVDGVKTPDWTTIRKNEDIDYDKVEEIGYPVVVKPNSEGSSIGISIVYEKKNLEKAVEEALKYDNTILIEKYIKGEEITCCILNEEVLPILSIKPKDEFFDYASKYEVNGAEEVVVELPKDIKDEVDRIAKVCWRSFDLKVYARIDMIVSGKDVYVLEINTLPGLTKNSLFPKSAKAVGIGFSELLDRIIQYSLEQS